MRLYDSFESKNHMCFVLELCGGGDLLSFIRRRRRLDEATAVYLFKQVVQAVVYCHDKGVVLRDINPEHILLQDEGNLKFTQFGESRFVDG